MPALPVYACAWNGNCDQVLYTNGKQLVIKPLQPGATVEQVPSSWQLSILQFGSE